MTAQVKTMTVEEFWDEYAGKPYELIRGVPVLLGSKGTDSRKNGEALPTGYAHSDVEHLVSHHLGHFIDKNPLGRILVGEAGFQLAPDVLRAADIAFVSSEKLKTITEPQKYLPFAPDLAVEIVSPGDTSSEIQDKLDLYLEAGTRLVWIVYPDLRKVVTHDSTGRTKSLGVDQTVDGGDVLPGFQVPVRDLFPPPPNS